MIRDNIKDNEYFEEYISYERERLAKRLNLIEKVIEQRGIDDSARKAYFSILNYSINILNASYSAGTPIQEFLIDLNAAITNNANTDFTNRYIEIVWLISLSIMLNSDQDKFKILNDLVEKYNLNDYLIDTLISKGKNDWNLSDNSFKFEKPYKSLGEVIELAASNKQAAIERLKSYLDNEWYTGHSDMGWYNSHDNPHDTYSGYWCWEAGALVKILELDDTILKDQQYYPYDMVHWKD